MGLSPGISFGATHNTNIIGLAYALKNNIRLDGGIGFSSLSNVFSCFAINIGGTYYLFKIDDVNTFVSGGLGLASTSYPGSTPSVTDFGFVIKFGAEYNFSPRFAINGVIGLQPIFGDNPTSVNTVQGLGFTWWFK